MFNERVEYSLKVTLGVRAGFNLESRLDFLDPAELFESFIVFPLPAPGWVAASGA